MPTPEIWDSIHRHGQLNPGGIWNYTQKRLEKTDTFRYLSSKGYDSLLDVSCNVGFMLASLLKSHPTAKHYGTDISRVMVESTRQNCPICTAAQFDLGNLRNPGVSPQDMLHEVWPVQDVPRTFDVVLVSDVLIYISWGGIPPFFLRCECCCGIFRSWALSSQRRFLENVASLAKDEVVFSRHQGSIIVTSMMEALGVPLENGVWRFPGTAKAA